MQTIRTTSGTSIKLWVKNLHSVESESMTQLDEMGNLPFVFPHIAVMPDVHLGKGAVIGSVFPALNAVVPNIVGVDIGCGISAFDTGHTFSELRETGIEPRELWRNWEKNVLRAVPTGFHQHQKMSDWEGLNTTLRAKPLSNPMETKAPYQVGTLGGGNHFVEAQYDENDHLWMMIHSGSRNTGLKIAEHYNRKAEELLVRTNTPFPKSLGYLPEKDDLYHDYLHDMEWAISFALENRWTMLEHAIYELLALMDEAGTPSRKEISERIRREGINIHHNFARKEEHFGRNVLIHRKGATSARKGEIGIIPGSMGAHSYIVRGKGNLESLTSCSHGAGRVMSRNKARKNIPMEAYGQALKDTYTRPSKGTLDEAPQSYKNIEDVIESQSDLIEVVHRLQPIITLKGDPRAAED